MTLAGRVAAYAASPYGRRYPDSIPTVSPSGRWLTGHWVIGNDYRSRVKCNHCGGSATTRVFSVPRLRDEEISPFGVGQEGQDPTCSRHCKGITQRKRLAAIAHKGRKGWSPEQEQRFKERMTGERNPRWRGGRTTTGDGYVMLLRPDHHRAKSTGYVYEHILVMEQKIGRPLTPKEVVHHIDKNRANNAPENLRLYSTNTEHLKTEHPEAFAALLAATK